MQLELPFWPPNSVRALCLEYLAMRAENITAETRTDYETRMEWVCEVLGPLTPSETVTYAVIERVARAARSLLADPTIKMRLQWWAGAVRYGVLRGVTTAAPLPVPKWLQAGKRLDDFYTPAQFAEFALALPPGRVRKYAQLAFWTGQHTLDVETMQRWMLEPDYAWPDSPQRGRWWRRNHKNRRCQATWIPMEPELRELAVIWLQERGDAEFLLVGVVNNKRKFFDLAAERAELPRIRPNLGLRSSHASELISRQGVTHEYVRLVLGHQGEVRLAARPAGPARVEWTRPSVLTGHYLRPSPSTIRPRAQ